MDYAQHQYQDTLPKREKALRLVWEAARFLLFRPTPRWALHGWRRTLLRAFGATVGRGCKIDPTCVVWVPWNLTLGEFVALGPDVDCYTMAPITIGSKTTVSQRAFLCTGSHDVRDLRRPLVTRPIIIGDHAWIAAEAMVLPGVEIGEGAIIGARALVTRDMPAWTICAGQPCKPLKQRTLDESQSKNQTKSTRIGR